ncbi:MAG: DNA translocase FtsK [Treponema sp.]|nr:DNA translocase FtsK [Treponema sp.]
MPEAEHSVIRTSLSEVFARMDEDAGAQLEPDSFMPDAHYTRDRAEHIPSAVPASYPMEARTPAHSAADAAAAEDSAPAYREAYAAAQADEAANAAEAAEAEEIPVEMDVGPVLGYESAGYESEALNDDAPEISGSADNGGQRYHEQIERNLTTEHAYEDSAADLADAADIDAAADADYEADSDAESDAISDSDAISEEDSITEAAANSEPAALADNTSSDDDDTYAPFPGDTLELEDESDYAEEDSASYEDAAEYQEAEAAEADYTADEAPAQESAALPRAVQADGTPVPVPEQRQRRRVAHGPYEISTELLTKYEDDQYWIIDDETNQAAESLKGTLREFGIQAEVTGIRKGPVVTMFEILPAPGVKLSKIVALQDNIALRLAASSVRIVAPIPGKKAVGIEIPNKKRAIVSFRECIEQDLPEKMAVPVILGKDIEGETQIMDLVKTPHLLIAGSTGSGKSVCVNSIILSMLFKRSPNEVKMILIDPKIVELKLYNDIPHLLTPVITEPKRAMQALQYCLCEMERRYALLDGMGVRDISTYNKRIVERHIAAEKLPYLIVIIDEFADLMATTGKQLESVLARLAAMSRAVGIHLVLATQRPSIDVITGLIKANIPSRIAFMVASKTDSRIILDQMGADKLLGKGDMLYASSTDPFPVRIQGAFVSDQEVEDVVNAVKQWGEPEYIDDEIFVDDDEDEESELVLSADGEDPMYEKALDIVVQAGKASASYIQRRLKIGYNRAARLVEEMEERGIVGPANGSKPREIIHMP